MDWRDSFRKQIQENTRMIAQGVITYDQPILDIDTEVLNFSVGQNEIYSGAFSFSSNNGAFISGTVSVLGIRMKLSDNYFEGKSITIPFEFNAAGLECGEVFKGEIYIISSAGEYSIPYKATVCCMSENSEYGQLRTLTDFANLAQENYEKASELFYEKQFENLIPGLNEQYKELYRGYQGGLRSAENVENFLIDINKKSPVRLFVTGENIVDNQIELTTSEDTALFLQLEKRVWGYINVRIICEGDFLSVSKGEIRQSDFVGNAYGFQLLVNYEALHAGKNYGRVFFKYGNEEIVIPVIVSKQSSLSEDEVYSRQLAKTFKKLNVQIMNYYLEFRFNNIKKREWLSKSEVILNRMRQIYPLSELVELYAIHGLIAEGRRSLAIESLKALDGEKIKNDPVLYSYQLYLFCLVTSDQSKIKEALLRIADCYENNQDKNELLWFLLYLDSEMIENPASKLKMIKIHSSKGIMSPLLCFEAYMALTHEPTLLSSLGWFELQVLNFASKAKLHSPEIAKKVVFLTKHMERYSPIIHKILCDMYEEYRNPEIMGAICENLIRSKRTDEECFRWYSLAVDGGLRMNRLFENYMYCLPADYAKPLPRIIQLYFRYSADIEPKYKAALYANIIRYCSGDTTLLKDYYDKIKTFAIKMLELRAVDENLETIYSYMYDVDDEEYNTAFREHAYAVIFKHRFTIADDKAKKLIIIENSFEKETSVDISAAEVVAEVYSKKYELMLEYENGIRKKAGSEIIDEMFFNPSDYREDLIASEKINAGVCIFVIGEDKSFRNRDDRNIEYVRFLVDAVQVRNELRRNYRLVLMNYYLRSDDIAGLDSLLEGLEVSNLAADERSYVLEMFVQRDMFKQACRIIAEYGCEKVSPTVLARLCGHIYEHDLDEIGEELVTLISYAAFAADKYVEKSLEYLIKNLHAPVDKLKKLWRAAKGFGVETRELCERMLMQMLYSKKFIAEGEDIFDDYVSAVALPVVEIAWHTNNAFEVIIRDAILEDKYFERLLKIQRRGGELNELCALALILHFSKELEEKHIEQLEPSVEDILAYYIRYFMSRKIILEEFFAFRRYVPELSLYDGCCYVQHKADPAADVTISYMLQGGDEQPDYIESPMRNLKNGIFIKEFVVFYGEALSCYIKEKNGEKELIENSFKIEQEENLLEDCDRRYELINDMLVYREMNERISLIRLMDVYRRKLYVVENFFHHK